MGHCLHIENDKWYFDGMYKEENNHLKQEKKVIIHSQTEVFRHIMK